MYCLLVVLAKLSLLAKWLARKTPLRKPNRGEGIISVKPRPKSAHDFLGLLYCFIVLLCICVVSCPYVIYYPTVMAWYSLFVLKVLLNPKQTNKRSFKHMQSILLHLCSPYSTAAIPCLRRWFLPRSVSAETQASQLVVSGRTCDRNYKMLRNEGSQMLGETM